MGGTLTREYLVALHRSGNQGLIETLFHLLDL